METWTLSASFPVPREPKHGVELGIRFLCKVFQRESNPLFIHWFWTFLPREPVWAHLETLFCYYLFFASRVRFTWRTASCLKLLQGCQNRPLIIHTIAAFSGLCGLWNVCVSAWSWHVLRCWEWSDAVVLYTFCKDRCSVKPKIRTLASVSNNPARPLTLSATSFLKGWICNVTAQEQHVLSTLPVATG